MKQIECIHFYGRYYIGNPEVDQYLMLDIKNMKVTVLDELQFNIIGLLKEIKGNLKNV